MALKSAHFDSSRHISGLISTTRRHDESLANLVQLSYPTLIPGLRSPSDQVNDLVYFGRMLDKIRLAAAGKLPEGRQAARGTTMKGSFDSRCCKFLNID
jgi:hypothetical protein